MGDKWHITGETFGKDKITLWLTRDDNFRLAAKRAARPEVTSDDIAEAVAGGLLIPEHGVAWSVLLNNARAKAAIGEATMMDEAECYRQIADQIAVQRAAENESIPHVDIENLDALAVSGWRVIL